MEYRGPGAGTAQRIGHSTLDAALIADDIAREAAWWIAARSGLYAHPTTVWVDRAWDDLPGAEWERHQPRLCEEHCTRRERD